MFERMMYLAGLLIYSILVASLLVYANANILITILFLSILPAVVLWRLMKLTSQVPIVAVLIAFAVTIAFQIIAYVNGVWYELSPTEIRLFSLFPIEAFMAAFAHIIYFILVYEYFFDDRQSDRSPHPQLIYLFGGMTVLVSLALAYLYVFSGFFIPNAFAVLLILSSVIFGLALLVARGVRPILLKRVGLFTLTMIPVSLVYEYVSLQNDLRFFANPNEYLYSFIWLGQVVPLEELLFIIFVPFWLATIYELYLDDGK